MLVVAAEMYPFFLLKHGIHVELPTAATANKLGKYCIRATNYYYYRQQYGT